MSNNFPFFAISKKTGIPLGEIYDKLDFMIRTESLESYATLPAGTYQHRLKGQIARAELTERARRKEVESGPVSG